jgi:hypothetical protein
MGEVAAVLLSGLLSESCWLRPEGHVGRCWWRPSRAVVMAGHRGLQRMPGLLRWLRRRCMRVSHARRGLWRPSGRPGVPGLPRWCGGPGLGMRRARGGLGLSGLLGAGATPMGGWPGRGLPGGERAGLSGSSRQ